MRGRLITHPGYLAEKNNERWVFENEDYSQIIQSKFGYTVCDEQ